MSVWGGVTCIVNVPELLNFTSNSFYQLDKIIRLSLGFPVSSSVKWEQSLPQVHSDS